MNVRHLLIVLLVFLLFGTVLAQEVPPVPLLVECAGEEGVPCVERIDDVADLAGIWRRYFMSGTLVGTMSLADDGTFTIFEDPQMENAHVTGTIAFEDGIALIAADALPNVPAPCVTPGTYEVQLIRVTEQPVALIYRLIEDGCEGRSRDLAGPMLFVPVESPRLWSSAEAWVSEPGAIPCKRSVQSMVCLTIGK